MNKSKSLTFATLTLALASASCSRPEPVGDSHHLRPSCSIFDHETRQRIHNTLPYWNDAYRHSRLPFSGYLTILQHAQSELEHACGRNTSDYHQIKTRLASLYQRNK